MLILLPPSEGKAAATDGPPLDLASLSFPELARTRERVLAALVRTSARRDALAVLGVAPGLAEHVSRNVLLRELATQPAERVYTGVLYEALGLASLPPAARARADASVVIISALFGALRLSDSVPAYRLSMGVTLPRLGPLAAAWRPALQPVIAAAAGDGLVIDCRSSTYAAAWRPTRELAANVLQVRVLREQAGVRTVVSHMAKQTRGAIARRLLTSRRELRAVPDVLAALRPAYTVEATAPARTGLGWTLDVIVRDR
ncbi:MAG: peroxide stress protein YaaA [Gaiellales bacterium]